MVTLTPNVTQKFIITSLGDGSLALVGDPIAKFHKDITEKMTKDGMEIVAVCGGGKLFCDTDKKKMYVWGKSTVYGDFSLTDAKKLLLPAFPEYVLVNEEWVV